jgi:excisionase family DNA binding protein
VTARTGGGVELTLSIPDELLSAIAERVAAIAVEHDEPREQTSPWLDAGEAATYLGISLSQLYKLTAANALPVRKRRRGQGLRFRRDELDAWIEAEYESTGSTQHIELSSTSNQ